MINEPPNHAVVAGAMVSLGSGAYSFFGTTLVVVQWLAATVAIVVGLMTGAHLIWQWVRKP